ncbi:hypothetical protein [Sediminibacillus halophilus]|uniref:Uncharacterized protein n=1 Tax=Sediminibacillus halophilus TaxID=482461 RepID=A0A1G9V1K0_9BACI|nr:hypothetical protein [Sediminibacillus halophilus]SDM66102.1 hypothetical protein SAMN05216244_3095 [Sediminibacillus halophilus]
MSNIVTYETYLQAIDNLTFEESTDIYNEIIKSANTNDQEFQEFWEDMMDNAITYANTRAKWSIQTSTERREVDERRTRQHNGFMASLKLIASYMKEQNWNAAWFDRLGTIENDRKRFGDFACYLVFINSINAR